MLLYQLALVSEISAISTAQLLRVGAALQKQASRDFGPIWNVDATVSAFTRLEDVPLGAWPVIVRDDINTPGAAGVHEDKDGQPFALVAYSDDWPLTTSHECLEMLADPFGNRLIAGRSVKRGQGRVEYLVEVCDPCEDASFAYTVNGILLSDFYTPHYFDPTKASGVQYSFTGAITHPREVLKGGYLSWHDPTTDHWWQVQYFGAHKTYRDLGVFTQRTASLRSIIDAMTPRPAQTSSRAAGVLGAEAEAEEAAAEGPNPKAQSWREQIEALKRGAPA
jgi:hypothetical protein